MKRYIDNGYIAQTACGLVQGRAGAPGITEFRGIRYATAERFARPELVTHWDGIYNATEFAALACSRARSSRKTASMHMNSAKAACLPTAKTACF